MAQRRRTDEAGIRKALAAACADAGSQDTWAKTNSVSPQYVTDVLKGRKPPGESITRALGYRRRVVYDIWEEQETL